MGPAKLSVFPLDSFISNVDQMSQWMKNNTEVPLLVYGCLFLPVVPLVFNWWKCCRLGVTHCCSVRFTGKIMFINTLQNVVIQIIWWLKYINYIYIIYIKIYNNWKLISTWLLKKIKNYLSLFQNLHLSLLPLLACTYLNNAWDVVLWALPLSVCLFKMNRLMYSPIVSRFG